jgi:signal transduction histidine kinase
VTRQAEIAAELRDNMRRGADRVFLWLLVAQWAVAIVLALVLTPYSWTGTTREIHFHVKAAVGFGFVMNSLPIALIVFRPGWWGTRHVVAVVQMMWSAMLIMITGGRIETHFHVFGSLAFLAFYRDWKVLVTATVAVSVDHLARGLAWPDSVYGVADPEWWRFLEHATWVAFEDVVLALGCVRGMAELARTAEREAKLENINAEIETVVATRTAELQDAMLRYRSLVETTDAIPFEYEVATRRVVYIAPQAARLLDCNPDELSASGFFTALSHPDDRTRVRTEVERFVASGGAGGLVLDYRLITKSNRVIYARSFLSSTDGRVVRGVMLDITKHKQLELELQQAQKLESVGRLAAGVAHEINTPVQFVSDSLTFVREGVEDLMNVVNMHRESTSLVLAGRPSEKVARDAEAAEHDLDLPYLLEQFPQALDRALDGLDRVAGIVRSMKIFAHPDSKDMAAIDLNTAIASTLTIARNEYKYVADVTTSFATLPPVSCHAGEINQAILNIIVNAAHAIADRKGTSDRRGTITVTTHVDGDSALISIGDTGNGVPYAIRDRIFEPFFTTKEVGRGTGQGLAIARSIVVDRHAGTLTFDTEPDRGTTFHIRIPLCPPKVAVAA